MKYMNRASMLIAALLLGFSLLADAKMLYVDPQGNDSVTYNANSASNPWGTIGRAAWGSADQSSQSASQAAKSGDTVIVRPGTYSTTGNGLRYAPVYNPINTGTASAPIIFQAEGTVILEQAGAGAVVGAYDKDYIIWKGFTIYEINATSVPDTGPVVLWQTTGSRVEDFVIDGNDTGHGFADNHNGIRLEYATDVVVRNNVIHNVHSTESGSEHHNGAGIMVYHSRGGLIENNEIYDTGAGIFIKGGDNRDFTIRYNLTRNNGTGIMLMYSINQGETKVYQNIVKENRLAGITLHIGAHNNTVANNALINNGDGASNKHCTSNNNNRFINNIIYNVDGELVNGGDGCAITDYPHLDRNIYHDNGPQWSTSGVAYSSFLAWRDALGSGAGNDNNSIVRDPFFVDAANNNFRLQSGSAARTLGIDILDLNNNSSTTDIIPVGAYITGNEIVGRTTVVASPPGGPLAVPANLRIQH